MHVFISWHSRWRHLIIKIYWNRRQRNSEKCICNLIIGMMQTYVLAWVVRISAGILITIFGSRVNSVLALTRLKCTTCTWQKFYNTPSRNTSSVMEYYGKFIRKSRHWTIKLYNSNSEKSGWYFPNRFDIWQTTPRLHDVCQTSRRHRLTHWGRVARGWDNILGHLWFRQWLVTCSASSHYLNQCQLVLDWTVGNKLQWCNWNRNWNIFIKKKMKMSSGKWRPFCLNLDMLTCNLARHRIFAIFGDKTSICLTDTDHLAKGKYRQVSNISSTLVGYKIVYLQMPVGAAPTTCSLST